MEYHIACEIICHMFFVPGLLLRIIFVRGISVIYCMYSSLNICTNITLSKIIQTHTQKYNMLVHVYKVPKQRKLVYGSRNQRLFLGKRRGSNSGWL